MNPGELQQIEAERQALLGQLTAAETAVRTCLKTAGFGETARDHLQRARAHICEAIIAINECKAIRSVPQLVDDLNRVQQVLDDARRRKSQRI
jgi:hypothetical protein